MNSKQRLFFLPCLAFIILDKDLVCFPSDKKSKICKQKEGAMFKRVIISLVCLLCISVFPILETVASAAISRPKCPAGYTYRCPIIGGTKCCGCWKTGSEICTVDITGIAPGTVACSVFGTVPIPSPAPAEGGDGICDPNTIDPDCGIQGVAFCGDPKAPSKNPIILSTVLTGKREILSCYVGEGCSCETTPVDTTCCEITIDKTTNEERTTRCCETTIDETTKEKRTTCKDCAKKTPEGNSICQQEIELDPVACPDCCIDKENKYLGDFITFTAQKFIGKICVSTENGEVCLNQQCYIGKADFAGYKPGQNIPYKCTSFPDDFGSGR